MNEPELCQMDILARKWPPLPKEQVPPPKWADAVPPVEEPKADDDG